MATFFVLHMEYATLRLGIAHALMDSRDMTVALISVFAPTNAVVMDIVFEIINVIVMIHGGLQTVPSKFTLIVLHPVLSMDRV